MSVEAPASEEVLLQRAHAIAGLELAELARRARQPVPRTLHRAKGWVGELVESLLGATAQNRPEPDFPALGVELKTLPVDARGLPRESTYVCTVPLMNANLDWEDSTVRRKLQRVLWIPVEADPEIPVAARRLGSPLLWSPGPAETDALRSDWEELMEMICRGQVEAITARQGRYLQIRPKAVNSRQLCWAIDEEGHRFETLPRGFYLRSRFTASLLGVAYAIHA